MKVRQLSAKMALNAIVRDGVPEDTAKLFFAWHHDHLEVWEAFQFKAIKLIERGVAHYGSKAIFEVIRFEHTIRSGGDFKVNNNFAPYYARLFALKYPDHADFFETREIRGLKAA